jgi:hypothetical protein
MAIGGRDEFILKFAKIEGIPFLPVLSPADPWTPPKTIVFCLGYHGTHVWTQLTAIEYPASIYPILARRADVISKVRQTVHPQETVVVSGLSDEMLDKTLLDFEMREERGGRLLEALLIYPYSCEGMRRKKEADRNLERMKRLGWNATIINPMETRIPEIGTLGRNIDVHEVWKVDENRIVETILGRTENEP